MEDTIQVSRVTVSRFIAGSPYVLKASKDDLIVCETTGGYTHAILKDEGQLETLLGIEADTLWVYAGKGQGDIHALLVAKGFELSDAEALLPTSHYVVFAR